jgi:murein DD-endopeptidase MepM/ murein hydrolase activator NlpD
MRKTLLFSSLTLGLAGLGIRCACAADELPYATPVSSAAAASPVALSPTSSAMPVVALSTEPFVSPLGKGKFKIVSGFGKRPVPTDATKTENHEGIDIAVLAGAPIRAARSGKILFAGFSKAYASRIDKTDQNRLVIVRHADGMSSRYVHLDSLRVRPMQEVTAGQVLGTAAESDEWTESVLHFEIREVNGTPVNPRPLLTVVKP